jgi:valyl-tRNA synthetase
VDTWLASRLHRVSRSVNLALEEFRFHEAAHELYHFFWHEFCDWYLEWIKPIIAATNNKSAVPSGPEQQAAWRYLFTHFEWALCLLHPFMPFITEELWRGLFDAERTLALQPYPEGNPAAFNDSVEQEMALVQEAIVALRNIRAEMKIDARHRVPGELAATDQTVLALFRAHREAVLRLANLSALDLSAGPLPTAGGVLRHAARFDAHITLTGADLAAELKRLHKEKQKLEKELDAMRARLADQHFRRKAPESVVRGLEQRQAEYNSQYERVTKLLSTLKGRGNTGGAPA